MQKVSHNLHTVILECKKEKDGLRKRSRYDIITALYSYLSPEDTVLKQNIIRAIQEHIGSDRTTPFENDPPKDQPPRLAGLNGIPGHTPKGLTLYCSFSWTFSFNGNVSSLHYRNATK